jgi:hypothetical protein
MYGLDEVAVTQLPHSSLNQSACLRPRNSGLGLGTTYLQGRRNGKGTDIPPLRLDQRLYIVGSTVFLFPAVQSHRRFPSFMAGVFCYMKVL